MRLVPIPPPQLDDAQRQLFDSIVSFTKAQHANFSFENHEGALIGPFNPMLHFPQFGKAAWGVNVALSENTTLPRPVHELVILLTGARFSSRYEIYAHEIVADGAGLAKDKVASLAAGGRPGNLTDDESIAFDVASVLTRGAQLPDSTYRAAVTAFGEQGVAEMIYLVGFYCLISVLLNGYDAAVPGSAETR